MADPVQVLIARGMHALHEEGDLRTSRRWFEQACQVADETGDRWALVTAATGLGGLWVHEQRNAAARARVQAWQARALSVAAAGTDDHLLLRARVAAETDYVNGRHDGVLALLEEARNRDDPRLLASVLSLAHHCLLGPAHAVLRAELAQELLWTASRTERRADRLMGLLWRSVDLFLAGDPHAKRSLGQLSAALTDADHLAVSFALQAIEVMLTIRAGDFDRAERLAGECIAAGEIAGDADAAGWYRAQIMAIRWFQGRIVDLLPLLTGQVHAPEQSAIDDSMISALAVAAATNGDHRTATGALARIGHGDLTELASSSIWLVTLYGVVEAAALLADRDTATTAYALLKPYARLPMTASLAVTCFGSVEHALGMASLTTGHVERAIGHLRRAVRANLALEHWPAACASRHRLAQALAQRNGPGDQAEASREETTAQREADELGMTLPAALGPAGAQDADHAGAHDPGLPAGPARPQDQGGRRDGPVANGRLVPNGRDRPAGGPGQPVPNGSNGLNGPNGPVPNGSNGLNGPDGPVPNGPNGQRTDRTENEQVQNGPHPPTEHDEPVRPVLRPASAGHDWPGLAPVDLGRAEAAGAQISLLGPLEVRVGGIMRPVLGNRRRTVLAVLALHAGEIVSVDRLIDIVWGDRPPRTAINTLQSHVSYLRRVIGDKAGIFARPPGYLLDLGGDLTDVAAAERLIQLGSRFPDLQRRVEHLRAALALWRGRPLVDVTASTWLDQQAERLNHLLLQAHQALAEARLGLGENSVLALELQPLIREHPLAERLHGQLMLALYREGRQSEALEVYRRLRSVLSAELGVEPTESLRDLHVAILRQDTNL